MKKHIVLRLKLKCIGFAFFLIFSERLLCEEKKTDLELLWQKISISNSDIKSAKRNEKLSEKKLMYYSQVFLPKVSFSSSSVFSDFSVESLTSPCSFVSSATIQEQLPGGLAIDFGSDTTFNSRFLETTRSFWENYAEITNLSISISQLLRPFWVQNCLVNPEKTSVILEKTLNEVYTKIVFLERIKNFTQNYIGLRQVLRNIESTEASIGFYRSYLKSLQELKNKSEVSWNEIFIQEEKLFAAEESLIQYKKNKENILADMVETIGEQINQNGVSFFQNLCGVELPEISRFFSDNPNEEFLKIQKKMVETELIISRQNTSPVFVLEGNFPVHYLYKKTDLKNEVMKQNNNQWSVSASIDFSPLISSNQKLMEATYETSLIDYDEKLCKVQREIERFRINYAEQLKIIVNHEKIMLKKYQNCLERLESLDELFQIGECSVLDMEQLKLECLVAKNLLEDYKDSVWLIRWMLCNS